VDESASNTSGFAWDGKYVVSDDLAITNIYGDSLNLEWIQAYDPVTKKEDIGRLGDHLFAPRSTPGFDEYLEGNVELLTEDGSSGFSRELFRVTPAVSRVVDGKWDVDVSLNVEVFKPKGWCYATDGAGNSADAPTYLTFVGAK
jgi:hypothetical protein